MPRPGAAVTDAERALVGRALRQPRGRYVAERASQLSGIPARTLHDWATSGTLVPDWAGARPRAWSYRDVVYARLLAWLRSKGMDRASAAARVAQLRTALADPAEAPPPVAPLLADARPGGDDLPAAAADGRPGVALGADVATTDEHRPADGGRGPGRQYVDPARHATQAEPSPGGGLAEVAPYGGDPGGSAGGGAAEGVSDGDGDGEERHAGGGAERGVGGDLGRRTGGPAAQGVGGDGGAVGPRVHSDGHVLLVGDEALDRFSGQQAFAGVTGMLDAFSLTEPVEGVSRSGLWGPSLVRPSAHTTISPYTLGGEPCVAGSRVPTALLRALHVDRGLDVEAIGALYPFLSAEAIADALALEERLRAA